MKVVVDTSIWSLAFRRKTPIPSSHTLLLAEIIKDGRAVLIGVVRQELLSGIRFPEQYDRLRNQLRSFPDQSFEIEDYETAAAYFNTCMMNGVQGSMVDFLICAFATRRNFQIFTSDPDFNHFSQHISLSLITP